MQPGLSRRAGTLSRSRQMLTKRRLQQLRRRKAKEQPRERRNDTIESQVDFQIAILVWIEVNR